MRNLGRLLRYDWPLHGVLTLTNWLPDNVVFLRLRGWLASHFLGSCGTDLRLGRNITLYNPAKIQFGSNIYIAYGCWFMAKGRIRLGDEVLCGPYCVVVSSRHKSKSGSYRYGTSEADPIMVGRGSWLASRVVVTAGSVIGDGAAIAAGSVVRGEVPPGVLAAGQPAKVVRRRGARE